METLRGRLFHGNLAYTYRFILIRGHNGHTHRAGPYEMICSEAGEVRRGSA